MEKEVHAEYPNLNFYEENSTLFIRGSFPVKHDGEVLDRYSLEIEFPPGYPDSLPIVRETEGRIPRTKDFHIIDKTGVACLFVPDERSWIWPPGSSFLQFLNGPVYSFFLGQALVQLGQPWPFGQRSHGNKGILEFYTEKLQTTDTSTIVRYLDCLAKAQLKTYWECPCGSGRMIRECHSQLQDLKSKIPRRVIKNSLDKLRPEQG